MKKKKIATAKKTKSPKRIESVPRRLGARQQDRLCWFKSGGPQSPKSTRLTSEVDVV